MGKHTMSDLYQMQSLPLSAKISMTARRINEWVNEFGEDGVYLSFSGGKDSTVLGHIIREVCGYKNIPFVFVDVPTQYPELKQFAQTFDNLVILKPKISFAEVCEKIAYWPHEEIGFEACCEQNGSLKRYYLSDNSGARSSVTFIASKTLSHPVMMDSASSNEGGWASSYLNRYLNNRLYNALPDKWKQLIKQVKIKSSIGKQSLTVSSSDCYIFTPCISELVPSMTQEPYASEGTIISHFSSNESRICYNPSGAAVKYWTRSPSLGWDSYNFRIDSTGAYQAVTQLSSKDVYVRIMISM